MNYALDALWWRLHNPVIRDLASLLTAPPLWQNDHELPIRTLLGDQGFRFLLHLDQQNNPIPLSPHQKLGHYAEELLAYWFQHAPHSQLIAREYPIYSNQQTIGALDFIVELSGSLYHIELCCKYYASQNGEPEYMSGLNPQDTLWHKQSKLQQQLALSQQPQAQASLAQLNMAWDTIKHASIIRGNAFTYSGSLPCFPTYCPSAWTGILIEHAQQWQQFPAEARFYCLPKNAYLAPARVNISETLSRQQAINGDAGIYALLEQRPDQYWHESQRIMYRPF